MLEIYYTYHKALTECSRLINNAKLSENISQSAKKCDLPHTPFSIRNGFVGSLDFKFAVRISLTQAGLVVNHSLAD